MVVLDDLKNLMIYKKPFFLPIDEDDKKKNSAVILLTPNYRSSVNTMKAPYLINRRYFESYYLEKNVYRYISPNGKTEEPVDEQYLFEVSEASLTTKERNSLPDSAFGLPSQRRYPMPDENHVLLAIRFFNHVEEEYEKELSGSITKKIKEFKMEDNVNVTKNNRYYQYWIKAFPNAVNESISSSINNNFNESLVNNSLKKINGYISHEQIRHNIYLVKRYRQYDNKKNKEDWLYLLNEKGDICSHALVIIDPKETIKKDGGELYSLNTPKAHQNHGYATQILICAVNDLDVKYLSIRLSDENGNAHKLYTKLGFKEYERNDEFIFLSIDHKIDENKFIRESVIKEIGEDDVSTPLKNGKEIINAINTALEKNGLKAHMSKNGEWGINNFLSGKSKSLCLGSFNKDMYNIAYSIVKDAVKPYGASVSKDNYFTIFVNVKKNMNEATSDPDLYFVSQDSDISNLQPRIPDNFMTKNGYEDNKTPRVCFSTSIDGCLRALSQNCTGKEFYIYKPVGNYDIVTPTRKQVPDVGITNERWIKSNVSLKCVGLINVTGSSNNDGYTYYYGKNNEHSATLYDWNWKWVSKYNESFDDDNEEDYALSYYFDDEINKKFSNTANMADIDDEPINEDFDDLLFSNAPIITEADIEKEVKKGKYYPIFIVNSFTFTKFGKLTKKVTPKLIGEYSHSGMAFSAGLNNIYSYNMANGVNKLGGFNVESLKGYLNTNAESKIAVNVFFVRAKHFKLIHDYVRELKSNVKDTKYAVADLFRILLGKVDKKANLSMVCSEFVYQVLKKIGADPLNKDLVTPDELNNLKDDVKVFNVFNGLAKDYNPTAIKNKVEEIKDKAKLISEEAVNHELFRSIFNEAYIKKIETCTGIIIDPHGKILVEKHRRTNSINVPGGKMEPGETELECLKRELKEEVNINVTKTRFLYDFSFTFNYTNDPTDYLCTDHLYLVEDFEGTPSNMEREKHEFVKFASIEELMLYDGELSKILNRFIAEYGSKMRKDPLKYISKKIDISNLVYTGDAGGLSIIQQYVNTNTLKKIFSNCSIPYPKSKITIIVSGSRQEYGYIDENTITVLSKRAFDDEFANYSYEDYTKFIMATYAYCTVNPKLSYTILNPLAMYKSGTVDNQINNTTDHRYDIERIFKYIDDTYGDREILSIVKTNDINRVFRYGKELLKKNNKFINFKEFASLEDNYHQLSEEELSTMDDISNLGDKIARKIKSASVYKLNKIKRDVERGNSGVENRGITTTVQRLKSNDVVSAPTPTTPADSSNKEENALCESADLLKAWAHDEYLMFENCLYFFEDATNYDLALRNALYNDRIKTSKEIMNIYKQVKSDCPFIRWTFTNLNRYDKKNLFVDLSFYNDSFFRNVVNTDSSREASGSIKIAKIYMELLKRLINDNRIDSYKKKTIFIPVLDWRHNNSTRMWMYREDLNPISIIYNLMRTNQAELKALFKNTTLVFMGPHNYFKLVFDEVDFGKDQVVMKFMTNIKRIISLGYNSVDPDPMDEPTNSAKGIALDLVDKVEKSQNIEIKSVKPIMKAQTKVLEPISVDNKPQAAVKKIEVDKAPTTKAVVNNKVKVTKDENKKSTQVDTLKGKTVVNDPDNDKQKEELVKMIAKAAETSSTSDEAEDKLDEEEMFKALLLALRDQENENAKVNAARASRITELTSKFAESEVNGKSVKELLNQNPNDIKLPSTKLPVSSINHEWDNMTFVNFDKTYDPDADIVKMLNAMKDWSYPIAIRKINVLDNSSSEDFVYLWDIDCEDYKGTRFKLKVDIPQFINDRYLHLRGNDKSIMIQSTLMPIIKTDLDVCQIIGVGGYNKIFVRRYGNGAGKSLPMTDRLIKTLNRYPGTDIKITKGDNTRICNKYELPIDYIDLASYYNTVETNTTLLYFNQDELRQSYEIDDTKGLALGIRKASGTIKESIIYYDKSVAKDYKTVSSYITYLIAEGLNNAKDFFDIFDAVINTGKRYTYSQASILSVKIPLIIVCSYVEGLTTTLNKAKINYSFKQKIDKVDRTSTEIDYIKFKDGYLIYELSYESCMLLNGLKECDTESYSLKDMNTKQTYLDILSQFGGSLKADGIDNSYDCMIDPITKEILSIYKLPTDYVSVLLYANMLLVDNKFVNHTYMGVRRLRRKELIAGYFYKALTIAYQSYANQIRHSRKSVKMTIKQSAVIDMILSKDPSTNDVSVNNAINDLEAANTTTNKGLVGMNTDRAYSLDKRGYDESMLNVLGMSTAFSANVGINRQTTIDCNVVGSRGFIVPIDGDTSKLSTTKSLTITEALTPFGTTHDDPFRTLMTHIQSSKHMVRTMQGDPLLITNGADEAMPYLTSDTFAHKAKHNGTVIELNKDEEHDGRNAYMVIEYVDGSHEFIDLSETIKKNSDGGYSVPMKLDTDLQVGKKVKENQIVAYDKSSFSSSLGESGNLAINIGTLAKVAIINTAEGFEDSAAIGERFAKKLGTEVIEKDDRVINKNANVAIMKRIGDQVMQGDVLLKSQMSFDDDVANSLLRNLSMNAEEISELGQNPLIASCSGILQDIKIYRTVELNELSPSLQKIVKAYESPINKKKKIYEQYGLNPNILPATHKLDNVGKTKNVYDGVLIEFYIKYIDDMGIGDKIVFYSANKGVIKYMIPEGQEPYTDFRREEPIDAFMSIGSGDARMVCSPILYGAIAKLMVELDRSCKDMAGIPYDPSTI